MNINGKVTKGQLPKHTVSVKVLRQVLTAAEFDSLMKKYVAYRDKGLFEKKK